MSRIVSKCHRVQGGGSLARWMLRWRRSRSRPSFNTRYLSHTPFVARWTGDSLFRPRFSAPRAKAPAGIQPLPSDRSPAPATPDRPRPTTPSPHPVPSRRHPRPTQIAAAGPGSKVPLPRLNHPTPQKPAIVRGAARHRRARASAPDPRPPHGQPVLRRIPGLQTQLRPAGPPASVRSCRALPGFATPSS